MDTNIYSQIREYVSSVLTVISTGIIALYNQKKIPERMSSHGHFATEYSKLSREINSELLLRDHGENVYSNIGEFAKVIKSKMDNLSDNELDIPDKVYKILHKKQSSGKNKTYQVDESSIGFKTLSNNDGHIV